MSTNFWELLQQHQGDLTKSGRTVAEYLVQHAAEAQYLSISSLARECQVAEATVFRFCRALGFEGYHEMRIALAQANATGVLVNQQEPAPDADTATLCEHASALFMTAINGTQNALSPQAVEQAVALLHSARQVFCMGQGGSMVAASEICARFACITNKFRAVADSHMQVMAASLMTEQDVVLFVSYSGATRDLMETLRTAKANGAKIILITHYEDSPGAKLADVVLLCGAQESPLDSGSIPIKVAVLYVAEVLVLRYILDDKPGSTEAQERTTEALAVLMPFKAQEIWDRGGVYYGQNAISKNLIVADRRQLLNGNAFILGVSGSGKSFSAKKEMVSLALSTQDDIIVIDPESEYRPLIEGLGGQVINISATSPNHINAMDMEQGYGDGENPVVLKSEFLLSLCEQLIGAGKLSAKEKSVIDRCTAQVYRDYIRSGYHGAVPTLQDFHAELLRQPEKEAQDVALAIELFTDGSLNTFAKPTNVDTNARILCYDIRDLGKQLLPVGMLVVLDSIFNRIIRNRGLKRNTWIYIDEIYLLFQHEYSANFLFTLWKRMRKYQACGTGISQNIEDLLQSHTARTMLANSEFLIMLNQAATDREELARLLNISDNQLSYITNVDSGRGLIKCGSAIVPFVDHFPKNKLYRLMTTKPSDLAA